MCIRFILTLIYSFYLTGLLQAQDCSYSLTGVIVDAKRQALPGANVLLLQLDKGTSTNSKGQFKFDNLCAGAYTIKMSYVGYLEQSAEIEIPLDSPLEIILQEDQLFLDDVKVEGSFAAGPVQSVGLLSDRDFDLVQGKSLGESLKSLPGISALQTGPAIFKPIIHGLHSQRILILNNGIRQEGQQWGPEHAPEIDPFIANEIQVIKGADAIRYGADALGGVIIIDTPPLHQTEGLGGEINLMGTSNGGMGILSAMLEGDFSGSKNWGWRLQGTMKKAGDFKAANYYLSNTGVEEFNASGALGFKGENKGVEIFLSTFNSEIGILRSAHTGSLSDLESAINSERPWFVRDFTYNIENPRQKIGHHLLKINAYTFIGENKLEVQYGSQLNERREFDIRRGGRGNTPALSLQLFTQTLDASLAHSTGVSEGSLGVNLTYKNNQNVPGTGIRPLIPNYEQMNVGIFLIEHFEKKDWVYEFGIRYDHQYLLVRTFTTSRDLIKPSFNFDYVSGSVGAHKKLNTRSVVNTHLGLSSRPPHVSELYSEGLHHGTASIEEGLMIDNGEPLSERSLINKERSLKWTSTYQYSSRKLSAELTGYINYIGNYIFLRPTSTRLTIRGAFPVFQHTQTNALLSGLDFTMRADISKKLDYRLKLSYLRGEDLSNNSVLIFLPPVQFENAITYSTPLNGKISDLFVTLAVPTNLKQYRAPMVIRPADVRDYDGTELFDFAEAPKGFTLINVESGFKFELAKRIMSVIFIAENLTNQSYRNYMNRLRYFADDVGRNFIVKLKYDFHAHD